MREDALSIAWRDVLMGMIALLIAMMSVLFLLVNPPVPPETKAAVTSPGNFIVTIVWPEGNNDVDLWMTAPGEEKPVGFKNRAGKVWNLLRDDLGFSSDATNLNYENGYSRGQPDGDYTVYVWCYRCPMRPVNVTVSLEQADEQGTKMITSKVVTLDGDNDGEVAFNWKVLNRKVTTWNSVQREVLESL